MRLSSMRASSGMADSVEEEGTASLILLLIGRPYKLMKIQKKTCTCVHTIEQKTVRVQHFAVFQGRDHGLLQQQYGGADSQS